MGGPCDVKRVIVTTGLRSQVFRHILSQMGKRDKRIWIFCCQVFENLFHDPKLGRSFHPRAKTFSSEIRWWGEGLGPWKKSPMFFDLTNIFGKNLPTFGESFQKFGGKWRKNLKYLTWNQGIRLKCV